MVRINSAVNRLKSLAISFLKKINITHKFDFAGHSFLYNDNIALNACQKEPDTIDWIQNNIGKDDVVFDIGANVGVFTMILSKFAKKVYAFEPSIFGYQTLIKNCYSNRLFSNVSVFNVGLSGEDKLGAVKYASGIGIESGSWGITAPADFEVGFQHEVLLSSVDSLIKRFGLQEPNHIKLDVDGEEPEILKGCIETLKKASFKSLLVELDETDTGSMDLLRSIGFFEIGKFTIGSKTPNNKRYNFVFRKK